MGLILQDESRTLTDRDVDQVVAEVVAALSRDHGARSADDRLGCRRARR